MGDKKRVLVIGNGAAGSQFTAKMAKSKKYAVTVVTPFAYSEVSVNMTKVLAMGTSEHMKSIYPLLREDGVEYVIDKCTSLSSTKAELLTGRVLDFDVCVVATGQNIPLFYPDINSPKFADRKIAVDEVWSQLQVAKSVVIGGGGAVGCELAADIKLRHRNKSVVLVHSHERLIGGMHEPFQDLAAQYLASMGVEVQLSDRVETHEAGEVVLASGRRLPCDLFISAFPRGANTEFLPAACLDPRGYVKVDACFRVQLLNNVFAFGDCCDMDIAKTYPKIYDQLGTLRHNVDALLSGGGKELRQHVRGRTVLGNFPGPLMVALGHSVEGGVGLGPDCPGLLGSFNWLCCVLSWPCSYPAGALVARVKSDFNDSIRPRKGKGFSG